MLHKLPTIIFLLGFNAFSLEKSSRGFYFGNTSATFPDSAALQQVSVSLQSGKPRKVSETLTELVWFCRFFHFLYKNFKTGLVKGPYRCFCPFRLYCGTDLSFWGLFTQPWLILSRRWHGGPLCSLSAGRWPYWNEEPRLNNTFVPQGPPMLRHFWNCKVLQISTRSGLRLEGHLLTLNRLDLVYGEALWGYQREPLLLWIHPCFSCLFINPVNLAELTLLIPRPRVRFDFFSYLLSIWLTRATWFEPVSSI